LENDKILENSQKNLPSRVRVLVLGGGIHGVGVLHDLASRGWNDIHLVEMNEIGSGTSSKSTKMIHGGLRYLRRISQFPMVSESLRERRLLLDLVPDLVTPIEILIPVLDGKGSSSLLIKIGLFLYDLLAQKNGISGHKKQKLENLKKEYPLLDYSKIRSVYSYWDAQTDDLALVNRVAESALKCGSKISEGITVTNVKADNDGWLVTVKDQEGNISKISALYVINCLGPWSNRLLEKSLIVPSHHAFNDKGIHLVFKDMGIKKGMLLQSPEDQRVFFVLPWKGYTLVGTTEEIYDGDPSSVEVTESDIEYLIGRCNRYLDKPLQKENIVTSFAGLRWLAAEEQSLISSVSRESIVGERISKRGLLMTLYGGKLTSYRSLCEKIGDRITTHFGEFRQSKTADKSSWVSPVEAKTKVKNVVERFDASRSQ